MLGCVVKKDHEWMLAVLEDVRAFCEKNNLSNSEEAIRKALDISQSEVANDEASFSKSRNN